MKTNSVAIKGKDSCCGCGNCAISCPKNAVRMDLDREGFEYPTVDEKLCINCGKCTVAARWQFFMLKISCFHAMQDSIILIKST